MAFFQLFNASIADVVIVKYPLFWVQRIMVNGKRCELGLGSPPVTTLAHVRLTALDNKLMVRAGINPPHARREALGIPSFYKAAQGVF